MQKGIIKIAATLLFLCLVCYVAISGVPLPNNQRIPGVMDEEGGIRLGLDLRGGSVIVYQARTDSEQIPDQEQMESAYSVMRARLDALGYTEAAVTMQGADKLRLEIPGLNDPELAAQQLGATAQLRFVDYTGTEVMTGADVKSASAEYDFTNQNGVTKEHFVSLSFTEEGAAKFAEATGRIATMEAGQNVMMIMLDEDIVSSPRVSERIDDDSAIISGNFDRESANYLAGVIKSGQLQVGLDIMELRSISATLGEKALSTSVVAGIIGTLLIMLFMIVIYRLPGLLASIAMVGYIGMVGVILANFHVNLTLPGIAGIIISISFAIDANIIIFERIKEELRTGKTVRASVDAGFNRALRAIMDANVTTIFAAAVLWWLGTGPIKGFGITLFIGVLVSIISAVFITRLLLRSMVTLNLKQPWLYGVNKAKGGSSNV